MNSIQRTLKKTKILLVLFLIIGGFTYLILRPKPDPCFNGKQDGKETGVDCGGFCDTVCPDIEKAEYTKNVIINWSSFVADGKNNYDVAASISNNNTKWGASSVKYKFTLYDEDGEVVKEIEKTTYLMPKGNSSENIRYIVEENIYSLQKIAKIDFELSEYVWQEVSEDEKNELDSDTISMSDQAFWFDEGRNMYTGRAKTYNNSKYSFNIVDIGVVLYGQNNEILAVAKTNQLTMNSGDGWGFEILWPNLKVEKSEIQKIDARAFTNVFDDNNFIKDYKAR